MNRLDLYAAEAKVEVVSRSGDAALAPPDLLRNRLPEVSAVIREAVSRLRGDLLLQSVPEDEAKAGLKIKQIELKFGISFEAEAGALVGKAKGGGTFEVTLTLAM